MMRAFPGWILLLCAAAGCGGSPGTAYRPSEDAARKALDQALATWQKGGKPDTVGPSVHVADGQWQSGAALDGYEILGPDEGGNDAQAWFKVVLKLKKPPAEKPARYVVVGKQDVWVYREEDYKKFMDMADDPKPAAKKRR